MWRQEWAWKMSVPWIGGKYWPDAIWLWHFPQGGYSTWRVRAWRVRIKFWLPRAPLQQHCWCRSCLPSRSVHFELSSWGLCASLLEVRGAPQPHLMLSCLNVGTLPRVPERRRREWSVCVAREDWKQSLDVRALFEFLSNLEYPFRHH